MNFTILELLLTSELTQFPLMELTDHVTSVIEVIDPVTLFALDVITVAAVGTLSTIWLLMTDVDGDLCVLVAGFIKVKAVVSLSGVTWLTQANRSVADWSELDSVTSDLGNIKPTVTGSSAAEDELV